MRNQATKRSFADFFFATSPEQWRVMGFFERFEQVVAVIVTIIISIVIVFSLFALVREVFGAIFLGRYDILSAEGFKRLFGMIMTVLIAMEFKHSIIKVAGRKESIIRVQTLVLIALMALARKLIILDIERVSPLVLAALAAALLALGVVYWLMREPGQGTRHKFSGSSLGRSAARRRPFPGPRAVQGAVTATRAKAAVGSNFLFQQGTGPQRETSSTSSPGLCPTRSTLRAVSGQDRRTANKSDRSAP